MTLKWPLVTAFLLTQADTMAKAHPLLMMAVVALGLVRVVVVEAAAVLAVAITHDSYDVDRRTGRELAAAPITREYDTV